MNNLDLYRDDLSCIYPLSSGFTGFRSSGASAAVALTFLFNQTELGLETDDPGFIVVWAKLFSVLSHRFVAVIFKFFGKGVHGWFKLLIRLLGRLCDYCLLIWFLICVNRSRLSSLRLLLLKFHFLALLNFTPNRWLASIGSWFRVICICDVSSASNFTTWLPFSAGSVFVLLRLFLLRFFNVLLCSVWLHDVVNQIIEIFLVNLFVASR